MTNSQTCDVLESKGAAVNNEADIGNFLKTEHHSDIRRDGLPPYSTRRRTKGLEKRKRRSSSQGDRPKQKQALRSRNCESQLEQRRSHSETEKVRMNMKKRNRRSHPRNCAFANLNTPKRNSGEVKSRGVNRIENDENCNNKGVEQELDVGTIQKDCKEWAENPISSVVPPPPTQGFRCPLCTRNDFHTKELLLDHMCWLHHLGLSEKDLRKLKYLVLHEYEKVSRIGDTATPCVPKFSRPYKLEAVLAKRRRRAKLLPISRKINDEANNYTENAKPHFLNSEARLGDVFICLKCNEEMPTEREFLWHVRYEHVWTREEVLQWRASQVDILGPSKYWCPECSSTFVSKTAFTMHLKSSHEFVTDIPKYLENIGYEGDVPIFDDQCDICFEVILRPETYERHIRHHGVAFLRRHQLLKEIKTLSTMIDSRTEK